MLTKEAYLSIIKSEMEKLCRLHNELYPGANLPWDLIAHCKTSDDASFILGVISVLRSLLALHEAVS